MIANYHTHTPRCGHAVGTEEEYVQAAIQRGIKILGFADHSPQCYPDGYSSSLRMKPEQAEEYVSTILRLQERYQNSIELHAGVEMEYYPAYFADTLSLLRDSRVEYLILGQHYIGNEIGEKHNNQRTESEAKLKQYCRQVSDAVNTGLFTYVAHPDVLHFVGDPKIYQKYSRILCREANVCGIPLEFNLLGLNANLHYPNPQFWQIAAEEGCRVILGCDAHKPEALLDTATEQRALAYIKQLGLDVLDRVELRKI